MKPFIFVAALSLCGSVQAGLEGAYERTSGSEEKCPDGSLQTRILEGIDERVLIFGARHSWPLDMKDASKIREVVPGGCTYAWAYKKTDNRFVNRTTRSNCPSKTEDGVVTEKMTLRDKTLVYEFAFRKMNFKCRYTKKD